jgi:hypothetical protein
MYCKLKIAKCKFDDFVKSRHSRAGGNPESVNLAKILDSRFHGNDEKEHFPTFDEIIKFDKGKEISICNLIFAICILQ